MLQKADFIGSEKEVEGSLLRARLCLREGNSSGAQEWCERGLRGLKVAGSATPSAQLSVSDLSHLCLSQRTVAAELLYYATMSQLAQPAGLALLDESWKPAGASPQANGSGSSAVLGRTPARSSAKTPARTSRTKARTTTTSKAKTVKSSRTRKTKETASDDSGEPTTSTAISSAALEGEVLQVRLQEKENGFS